MKARVKSTGILIDVIPKFNINAQHSGDNLYVCDNMIFRECDLDFLNVENLMIDWEQRRYEIAKSAMQGMLAHSTRYKPRNPNMNWHNAIAEEAKELSDALIKELKKG